jgi:hypothetical protein
MDIEDGDRTIFTSVIEAQVAKLNTDDELLSYLQRHNHNFKMKNRKARALLSRQIKIAKESARKERMAFPMEEIAFGKSEESIDYLYETIISQSIQGETGTKSIFGNALLPKEIKTSFPQPTIFSKSEPTYDEIRKMLIFLFSYSFWVNMQIEKHDAEIDDYIEQLNSLLSEAGLPDLYYGNPHDWLYMYCALEENPLDTFRGIMAEVLCSDPNEIYDSAYNEE